MVSLVIYLQYDCSARSAANLIKEIKEIDTTEIKDIVLDTEE